MAAPYRLRAQRPSAEGSLNELLGRPVRSFYGAAHRASIVSIAPFVFLLAYVAWLAHQGQLFRWFNSTFSAVAVSVLFVLAIVLIAHTSAVGGGELVVLYEGGLVDRRIGPKSVRWDEIESLQTVFSPDGTSVVRHVLRTLDGSQISLGRSIANVQDLVDEVRVRMVDHVAPALRARIADGSEVGFGAIAASDRGLSLGSRSIGWDEVRAIDAEGADLVVRGEGGVRLAAVRLDEVPNAFLLAELAHERTR